MTIENEGSENQGTEFYAMCIVCGSFSLIASEEAWDYNDPRCETCVATSQRLRWMTCVDSKELSKTPFADRLRDLAVAYLESSKLLCVAVGDDPNALTWARGSVVLYTGYHALELFLKACIVRGSPNEKKFDHDLSRLQARFREVHPTLDPPRSWWNFVTITATGYENTPTPDFETRFDQIYRYASDKKGQTMRMIHNFGPGVVLRWIEDVEADFQRIWSAITLASS